MPPSVESRDADRPPRTLIVAVVDRDTRRQWSQALQQAGYVVRAASGPAELAKAHADGTAHLIIHREHPDDAALTRHATLPTLALPATVARHDLHAHLRQALATGER